MDQLPQLLRQRRLQMLRLLPWLIVVLLLGLLSNPSGAAFVGRAALHARCPPTNDRWVPRRPLRAALAALGLAAAGGGAGGESEQPPRAQGQPHHPQQHHPHTRRRRFPDELFLGNLTSPALMGWGDIHIDPEEVR